MKSVIIDTNILIDLLTIRQPFSKNTEIAVLATDQFNLD